MIKRIFAIDLGSPFAVNVMEVQRIMAIGKGLGSIPVHIPTSFTVLTQNSLGKDLRCSIKGIVE
jgi:hypothetical protein